jgi:hypothetical protein
MKDRLITFYEPVLTKSASGMETTTYRAITPQSWAEVNFQFTRGQESQEGKQIVSSSLIELKIWHRTDIKATFLILMEGIYYDLQKLSEGRLRRMETLIEAKAKDNDWSIPLFTP